jgi:hypothetical protein
MLKLILISSLLFFTGCTKSITYDLNGIKPDAATNLRELSISIETLRDVRKDWSMYKEELFYQDYPNDVECLNLENKYGNISPSEKISALLAKHFAAKKTFKKVFLNHNDSADLILTGDFASFAAHASLDEGKRYAQNVGMHFGLIGSLVSAAVTANNKSIFDYSISYRNIIVKDRKNNTICTIGEFCTTEHIQISAVTDCDDVYGLLNDKLKIHNDNFINKLLAEISRGLSQAPKT